MTDPQTRAKAIALRASGLRNFEIAKQLGIHFTTVSRLLKNCGIPLPLIRYPKIAKEIVRGPQDKSRMQFIADAYRKGKTLQQIGDVFNVTRERIRQLLRKAGVDSDLGGSHLRSFVRQSANHRKVAEREAARIAKVEAYFGCCFDEIARIAGREFARAPWVHIKRLGAKNAGVAFIHQKRAAGRRNIEWELSLTGWWRIWQESGHWEQRGRGKGYCMARRGDSGPYSVDNVYICTVGQNFSDSWLVNRRGHSTEKKESQNLSAIEMQAVALRNTGLTRHQVALRLNRSDGSISWALNKAKTKLAAMVAA